MRPIITSILDLDLYKLTVGQVVFTYFRGTPVVYRMKIRNEQAIRYGTYVDDYEYRNHIDALKDLSLTAEEAAYLRTLNLFTEDYIQFLMNKPMSGVRVSSYLGGNTLFSPPEASGPWERAMLYEIFCLSIGNEMYARDYCPRNDITTEAVFETAKTRFSRKLSELSKHPINLVEFGTRRRMSKNWQEFIVRTLKEHHSIMGTSNVHLARTLNIPVKGTFGHEFMMGLQGLFPLHESQKKGFELWAKHWNGKLAIALDDTLGDAKFLRDFTPDLMAKYDGLRHDSGDPDKWVESRINMYSRAGIDPLTKLAFFSDGLTVGSAIWLDEKWNRKIKTGFGIGTNLTNDSFIPVPQAVMKIVSSNGVPCVKLSNNPDKASCDDPKTLEYVKHVAEKY